MNALAPYLLAQYQRDLLAEAEIARRVKLATASQSDVAAWRRALAGLLASAAQVIDPCITAAPVVRRAA